MSECTHMVTDNRIGPNFGRPLVHRECSKEMAASRAREAALVARVAIADDIVSNLEAIDLRPCDYECRHNDCAAARGVKRYRAILAAASEQKGQGEPNCTGDRHVVDPSGKACVCGGFSMGRLL